MSIHSSEPVPTGRSEEVWVAPRGQPFPSTTSRNLQTNPPVELALEERAKMSTVERQNYLEKLQRVPDDADSMDWHLAQRTSWWGRKLDPKEFWNGKVLWLDKTALEAARKRGRGSPPLPEGYRGWANTRSDEDVDTTKLYEVEGPNIRYKSSAREHAFWTDFPKHHPQPPETLELSQRLYADQVISRRARAEAQNGQRLRVLAKEEPLAFDEARALGFPPEALTDDALFWAYVAEKRRDYVRSFASSRVVYAPSLSAFLSNLYVNPTYVTNEPTAAQLQLANAWKIAYLQRLRREKTDESYINAYLKAWNLSAAEVFGPTNR